MMTEQTILAPSGQTRTERAAALLYAWPAISEAERSELLQFLKREPITEIGLLAGRAELKGRIEAFRAEHSQRILLLHDGRAGLAQIDRGDAGFLGDPVQA